MRERNIFNLAGGKRYTGDTPHKYMCALEAIVAVNADPEHQHRIKVIIPSIDENVIHDRWIKRIVWWAGAPGYGDFHIPELGSEVVLFGRLAEKHNLYYASVYNEKFIVPADFRRPTIRGFRTDGDYASIVELDQQIRAGRLRIETDASTELIAPGGFFINGRRIG
ncbi:MAG: phage baseplate assembly protein V [Blastocatellia bacterium]